MRTVLLRALKTILPRGVVVPREMLVQRTLTGFFAVVSEMHSQSQHGRITASRLFRPAFVRLSSMVLYAAKVNGNYASSLSRSSTFVVSQENCRHAEKYKMAPCYEFFDFCSKQQQLGIYIHVGRQHKPGTCDLRTFSTISSCAHGHRSLCSDYCYSLHPGRWRVIGEPVQCIEPDEISALDRCVNRDVSIYSQISTCILQN